MASAERQAVRMTKDQLDNGEITADDFSRMVKSNLKWIHEFDAAMKREPRLTSASPVSILPMPTQRSQPCSTR